MIDLFNERITPVVFDQGSLGASGDLAPLAHLVLPLLGRGEVIYRGKVYKSDLILKKFGWIPVELQSKEGLALLNGTQFMTAYAVYIITMAERLSAIADIVSAISLEAYDGRPDPFFECVHAIRPHKGQIVTSKAFRKILEGSEIISRPKAHVQDPYSFRCIPQVHGASKDAIAYAKSVILTEVNSVTDNPTIFPDEDLIVSGGNFHGQPLALIFDHLAIALAELGSISERRVYRLIAGQRDLPEFLVANPGLNSGFMIPQYTAASVVSQNKQLCTPSSVDSIPSSNEQEDHVSMGANGATKLLSVAENLEKIIAIELFTAVQALEFRRPLRSSSYIEEVVKSYRKIISFVEDDKVMYGEIAKSIEFVRNFSMHLPFYAEL
jgi:histidine ammonia-lyase